MHSDLTALRPIDLYQHRADRRVVVALGDLLSVEDADPQRKAIVIVEAVGALVDRARRRLAGRHAQAARLDLRAAHRLFGWAARSSGAPEHRLELAAASAREFACLSGSLYHRELAVALEQAVAALLALTTRDEFACVSDQYAIAVQASALERAVAQHTFVGDLLADRDPGRRTPPPAEPDNAPPVASTDRASTEGDPMSTTTPRSPREKARLTRQRKLAVALVEQDHLTVAQAARAMKIPVAYAGALIRFEAEAREQAEDEHEMRARIHADWSRMAGDEDDHRPREDYLRDYTSRDLDAIEQLRRIPNRILRDLIAEHVAAVDPHLTFGELARRLKLRSSSSLTRTLGYRKATSTRKGGRRYGGRVQRTVSVQQAGAIVRALGIPPAEVPGL